jgi:hypothetical protein
MATGNKYKVTVSVPGHAPEVLTILADHPCDAITRGMQGVFQNPENSKAVPGIRVSAEALFSVVGGVAA